MKIVINAFSARIGGAQTYLLNLLNNLPGNFPLEIHIFAPRKLVLPIHDSIKRIYTKFPTENPILRAFWEIFLLPFYLRNEKADILFCPGGLNFTLAPASCKVISMFRNMMPFDKSLITKMPLNPQKIRNILIKRFILFTLFHSDLVIFISKYARDLILEKIKIKNYLVIPHGIPKNFYKSSKNIKRPILAPYGKYIIYVSRFDIYKHHINLINAFANIPIKLRNDLSLVFIGETNLPEFQHVQKLIQNLKLENKIRIIGAIPYSDLPGWYQNAESIVFASSCENCPNILMEALASGRPVLSSNVMPMPEFGGNKIQYFSPFDTNDITQAIIKIHSNKKFADYVAKAAFAQSLLFKLENQANKTWKAIISL